MNFPKSNFFKSQFLKIQFILLFIKELGGIGFFIKKTAKFFKQNGLKGAITKIRYIFYHANLAGNGKLIVPKYENWIKKYVQITPQHVLMMQQGIAEFQISPVITVIMPTFNSNPVWLTEAIESVRCQIYPKWELCIADDASSDSETISVLKKFEKADPRIKVVFRTENGHISLASNSAIEIATGDFIALLDHDDLLSKDALFWVAYAVNKNPDAALIYSDEDKVDNSGKHSDPYFKCDWNYSLFLSQNMISHLGVYRTKIVKEIGGFRKGYEGSQDYDLALRFIQKIKADQIIHIPRALYHWRIHPDSTAKGSEIKPYAVLSAQKAITEHLQQNNINATVEVLPIFMYRVRYRLPEEMPFVNIIIPTRNNKTHLEKCISSLLLKTTYSNYGILIVDNNSDDIKTLKFLNNLKGNIKINIVTDNRPFNFSAINNRAVSHVQGEFLCFLNDDTEVISSDWLGEMVSIGLQAGVGAVGAKLWYPDNTLQHGGVILGIGGIGAHAHKGIPKKNNGYFNRANLIQEFSAVTAACMLVRKSIFEESGGFDEVNLGIAFNDVDFCLTLREKGYRIIWTPYAELYHHESVSRGDDFHSDQIDRFNEEIKFMLEKWGNLLKNDPAYSPNLTLKAENFDLAWPPRIDQQL